MTMRKQNNINYGKNIYLICVKFKLDAINGGNNHTLPVWRS